MYLIPFNAKQAIQQWQWSFLIILSEFRCSFNYIYLEGNLPFYYLLKKEECLEIYSIHPTTTNIEEVNSAIEKTNPWLSHTSINHIQLISLPRLDKWLHSSQELSQDWKKPKGPSIQLLSTLRTKEMSTKVLSEKWGLSIQMCLKSSKEASSMTKRTLPLSALTTNPNQHQIINWEFLHLKKTMLCWEVCSTRRWRRTVLSFCRCLDWMRKTKCFGSKAMEEATKWENYKSRTRN